MADHEDILDALTAYSRDSSQGIPEILNQYLNGVAKNGETLFQWPLLKPLVVGKMEQVIEQLRQGLGSENIPSRPNVENVRFEVMHTRIMEAMDKFNGAPFTIQRLCELLMDPKRHYKRSDKFMRGLEKNVLVVSTVDPFGRKVVSDGGNKHLVNGMDTNGSPFFPRDSNITSNLPPVPGWVTSSAANVAARSQAANPDMTLKDSAVTSNGIVSSVYEDQGDQPPAVHAEEVVETAVSMDTTEGTSVATDGGEAMAEDGEEEMGTEDTNVSTSSSSSSSSEDLSSSDTGESSGGANASGMVSSAVKMSEGRPFASIANEGETKSPVKIPSSASENFTETKLEKSSSPPQAPTDSSPSSSSTSSPKVPLDATSSHTGPPPMNDDEGDKTPTSSSAVVDSSRGDSTGFEPSLQASIAEGETMPSSSDLQHKASTVQMHLKSYAEVVASSSSFSTNPDCRNLSPLGPIEACDSVAGLERLVDSVDPNPSSPIKAKASAITSTSPSSFAPSPSLSITTEHAGPAFSRTKDRDEEEEPQPKRSRPSTDSGSSSPNEVSSESTPTHPISSSQAESDTPSVPSLSSTTATTPLTSSSDSVPQATADLTAPSSSSDMETSLASSRVITSPVTTPEVSTTTSTPSNNSEAASGSEEEKNVREQDESVQESSDDSKGPAGEASSEESMQDQPDTSDENVTSEAGSDQKPTNASSATPAPREGTPEKTTKSEDDKEHEPMEEN